MYIFDTKPTFSNLTISFLSFAHVHAYKKAHVNVP
jgi:hypothetical protein